MSDETTETLGPRRARTFLTQLREKLDDDESTEICWQPGGDGLVVRDRTKVETVWKSFTRTMHAWGFKKGISRRTKRTSQASSLPKQFCWYHEDELFTREDAEMGFQLQMAIKYKTKKKGIETEPQSPKHPLAVGSHAPSDNTTRTDTTSSDSETSDAKLSPPQLTAEPAWPIKTDFESQVCEHAMGTVSPATTFYTRDRSSGNKRSASRGFLGFEDPYESSMMGPFKSRGARRKSPPYMDLDAKDECELVDDSQNAERSHTPCVVIETSLVSVTSKRQRLCEENDGGDDEEDRSDEQSISSIREYEKMPNGWIGLCRTARSSIEHDDDVDSRFLREICPLLAHGPDLGVASHNGDPAVAPSFPASSSASHHVDGWDNEQAMNRFWAIVKSFLRSHSMDGNNSTENLTGITNAVEDLDILLRMSRFSSTLTTAPYTSRDSDNMLNIHRIVWEDFRKKVHLPRSDTMVEQKYWLKKKLQDLLSSHFMEEKENSEGDSKASAAAIEALSNQLEGLQRITTGRRRRRKAQQNSNHRDDDDDDDDGDDKHNNRDVDRWNADDAFSGSDHDMDEDGNVDKDDDVEHSHVDVNGTNVNANLGRVPSSEDCIQSEAPHKDSLNSDRETQERPTLITASGKARVVGDGEEYDMGLTSTKPLSARRPGMASTRSTLTVSSAPGEFGSADGRRQDHHGWRNGASDNRRGQLQHTGGRPHPRVNDTESDLRAIDMAASRIPSISSTTSDEGVSALSGDSRSQRSKSPLGLHDKRRNSAGSLGAATAPPLGAHGGGRGQHRRARRNRSGSHKPPPPIAPFLDDLLYERDQLREEIDQVRMDTVQYRNEVAKLTEENSEMSSLLSCAKSSYAEDHQLADSIRKQIVVFQQKIQKANEEYDMVHAEAERAKEQRDQMKKTVSLLSGASSHVMAAVQERRRSGDHMTRGITDEVRRQKEAEMAHRAAANAGDSQDKSVHRSLSAPLSGSDLVNGGNDSGQLSTTSTQDDDRHSSGETTATCSATSSSNASSATNGGSSNNTSNNKRGENGEASTLEKMGRLRSDLLQEIGDEKLPRKTASIASLGSAGGGVGLATSSSLSTLRPGGLEASRKNRSDRERTGSLDAFRQLLSEAGGGGGNNGGSVGGGNEPSANQGIRGFLRGSGNASGNNNGADGTNNSRERTSSSDAFKELIAGSVGVLTQADETNPTRSLSRKSSGNMNTLMGGGNVAATTNSGDGANGAGRERSGSLDALKTLWDVAAGSNRKGKDKNHSSMEFNMDAGGGSIRADDLLSDDDISKATQPREGESNNTSEAGSGFQGSSEDFHDSILDEVARRRYGMPHERDSFSGAMGHASWAPSFNVRLDASGNEISSNGNDAGPRLVLRRNSSQSDLESKNNSSISNVSLRSSKSSKKTKGKKTKVKRATSFGKTSLAMDILSEAGDLNNPSHESHPHHEEYRAAAANGQIQENHPKGGVENRRQFLQRKSSFTSMFSSFVSGPESGASNSDGSSFRDSGRSIGSGGGREPLSGAWSSARGSGTASRLLPKPSLVDRQHSAPACSTKSGNHNSGRQHESGGSAFGMLKGLMQGLSIEEATAS